MLVCPQCQFENPNANKFCQKCGTSLSHKSCNQCNAEVPLSAEHCPNCGALTGKVWWAIISQAPDLTGSQEISQPVASATTVQEAESTSVVSESTASVTTPDAALQSLTSPAEENVVADNVQPSVVAPVDKSLDDAEQQQTSSNLGASSNGDESSQEASLPMSAQIVYVDSQQRYQVLDGLTPQQSATALVQVRVLDCQPYQKSPLEAIADQQQGLSGRRAPLDLVPGSLNADSWNAMGIPAIAHPYLALQQSLFPTLPKIHDAWQQNGQAVVLVEDRSQWPLLVNLWRNDEVPPLQILYWLDEMAKLWLALEPWHSRQSILEINNLRVDEDQTLSLQQLYQDPEDANLTPQDLGVMWQMLFQQSQRTQFNSLDQLLRDLRTGDLDRIDAVRSRLEAIANELQVNTATFNADPKEEVTAEITEGDDTPTVILPMQLIGLEDAGATDIGRQRNHNEDCFGIQTNVSKQHNPMSRSVQARGVYILCDGMGGHAGGEEASAMAVESLKNYFETNWKDELPDESTISEAVLTANQAIYDINQKNARSGSGRMGTTLVMVLIKDTKVAIAHVGDSRLYAVTRKRGLEQLTVDHEVGQREIQRGVEEAIAYSRPDAYQLTQALGPRDESFVKPDIQFLDLHEDCLLILASDGLTDNDLLETYWQSHLAPLLSSRTNLEQGVAQLIDLANQHNGHDNITAVVIRAKVRPNLDQQQRV